MFVACFPPEFPGQACIHVFPNQCHELRGGDSKKKDSCARVNEAKVEPGGEQEHNLIRTEKLIIRPFCRVDDKLAKVKKRYNGVTYPLAVVQRSRIWEALKVHQFCT